MKHNWCNLLMVLGLVLALGSTGTALPGAQAQGPRPPDDGALPSASWWEQAQAHVRQSEYHVTWHDSSAVPGAPAGYQAPNRAQDLRTYFYPDGLQLVRRTEREPSWVWGLALAGLGRAGAPAAPDAATLTVHENRVIYRRGGLQETYVNAESGLEQTLSISAPPAGRAAGPLWIDLALSGDLTPHRRADGGLEFRHDGEPLLRYGALRAADVTGRALPVEWLLDSSHVLRIALDDAGAVYPVQVQAAITGLPGSPNWNDEANQANASLGFSVATAGDVNGDGFSDVIAGAPYYDAGAVDGGLVLVYHGSANGLPATSNWTVGGSQADECLGWSVATAGDVNGDGYSDVVAGAPFHDHGEIDEGAVYVYHGSSSGLATLAWEAEVNQVDAFLGFSVATAGDVNGDGYSDVVAGAPSYDAYASGDNRGLAAAWLGSSNGLQNPSNPAWLTFGSSDGESYGLSVATAGDVNADGYADVIVGGPDSDLAFQDSGRVYVYHGAAGGLSTSSAQSFYGAADLRLGFSVGTAGDVNGDGCADVIVGGGGGTSIRQARVYHGSSSGIGATPNWTIDDNQMAALCVATAGDLNGDGYADVVVGAGWYQNGQNFEGGVFVWHGSSSGLGAGGNLSTADWSVESNAALARFGRSVATAGDVNGDGYSDLIVGAPDYTSGEDKEGVIFVYHGGPDNLSQAAGWSYESDYADKNLGWSVATAGDVNGDGYADVVAGAPYYDSGESDEGAIFVWHGSEQGPSTAVDWTAFGDEVEAHLGYSVATAGDVNGDGYSDLIAGAPHWNNSAATEGAAFVWLGSSSGLGSSGSPANADWLAESDVGASQWGWSVSTAGDVNGDGYADVAIGAPTYANGNTNEGAVFVWHGSSGGLGASGTPANADWLDEGDADNAALGASVSTAGDVNRDGYSDLVAGGNNFAVAWYGSSGGLYTGGTNWFRADSGSFGYSVSTAGDVDGDGYSDVIVGAPYYTGSYSGEGRALAYCGGSSGLTANACWTDLGGSASAEFGWSVATAGDLNGDGYADVVVGAPSWSNPTTGEGQARVYYGSSLGPISLNGGDWRLESNRENAALGWSAATAGDVNGDGYADLLLGVPGYGNGQSNEGQVALYYGNGGRGVSLLPRQLHADGTAPTAPLGLSSSQTAFRVQGRIWSPVGRGKSQLQWEVKPWSVPFNNTGLFGTSWLDTGTGGLTVQGSISGLSANVPYHWRLRTAHDAVSQPFAPPHSRWFHVPWNGWNEADLRTAGSGASTGTCMSPAPLACGQPVSGDTTGRTSSIASYSCSGWNESGPEMIYAFTLAGSGLYTVTAELSGISGGDLDVFLLAAGGCESGQCLAVDAYGDTRATAGNVPAGTYYVAVDGFDGAVGSYTLSLTCTSSGGNSPPNVPCNPSPVHQAAGVSWNPTLSWTGGDPDGDTVEYTVVGRELGAVFYVAWCGPNTSVSCSPPSLQPGATYEWSVAARDGNGGSAWGPVWQFTTVRKAVYLPLIVRN